MHDWREVCPNSDPEVATLRFLKDGTFEWMYGDVSTWQHGGDETWGISEAMVTVSWSNGYAVSTYDLRRDDGRRLPGSSSKSCGDTITLERVDP